MRVLYCNKYNFGFSGTEAYLFELMEQMRQRDHETALFSAADPRGPATPYDRHFVPLVDFKSAGQGVMQRGRSAIGAIYSRQARSNLREMLIEFRPDVAHVRNIYHHLSPSILWELRKQKVPVLHHINDFKLLCPSYNMVSKGQACERCKGGVFRRVVAEGCYAGPRGAAVVLAAEGYVHRWLRTYQTCVDCFLAPSQFVKQKMVEHGWDARKIEVLPHFQVLPSQTSASALPGAPLLYFGRLSPEKGVVDLLRAMQFFPDVRLKIAGDGPQRGELYLLAQELGLENVEFAGHLRGAELQRAIAEAQFTVFPSRAYETFGKSILESYAWGRPVIASDLGPRRELVEEGETGLLYGAGNVEQLAAAIEFLVRRPELAARMGEAGRMQVRERYSPEQHLRALSRLYERLASQARKTTAREVLRATPGPLRIAFLGGRGVIGKYSGIETWYEEVGKRLVAMGHEVTVYCHDHFTPPLKEYAGMRLVRLPTVRSKHLETFVHTLLSTVHAMFSKYDVVHYHALGPALFSFLPRITGKKTVVTVQGLDWRRKKWGRVASAVLRFGERAAVRFPNLTTVVSRTLEGHYRDRHGAETLYLPNGTEVRAKRPVSYLDRWGLRPDNYILYLGRFSPEKNCHLLVEAFEKIDAPVKLVLAGGSSHSDGYVADLRKHQSDRIVFLDWASGEALYELLSHAMLFVLPSDIEGLSLALLDAMAAGVCVLTSDVPENVEVVEGIGFTFQAGNADDLGRMLRLLIVHPEIRRMSGKHGKERAFASYLWPQITKQVEQAYMDLLVPNADPARALH